MKLAHRLAQVTLFAAVVAAGFTVQSTTHAAEKPPRIIELPRVTVVANRASAQAAPPQTAVRIIELPRVVVIAKRPVPDTTWVAQR